MHADDEMVVEIRDKAYAVKDSNSDGSGSEDSADDGQMIQSEIIDPMLLKPVFVNREDRAILDPSIQQQE